MVFTNEGLTRMAQRLVQVAMMLVVAGCGVSSPGQSASDRPFMTTEIGRFDSPWAMSFLPGSGVPLTSMALVTEKGGKLWLIDTATGHKEEVAGVPAVHVEGQG